MAGLVLPYLKSRGTERQALKVALGLRERGWRVEVFVLEAAGDYFPAFHAEAFQPIVVSTAPLRRRGELSWRLVRRLSRLLRREGCDVVVSRASLANRAAFRAGLLARTPVVTFVSGAVPRDDGRFAAARSVASFYWNHGTAARVITVSEAGGARLSREIPGFGSRVRVVQNGVDVDRVRKLAREDITFPWEEGHFVVMYGGSLDLHRKGLDILMRGFAAFLEQGSGWGAARLVLTGSGADEGRLRDLAGALGVAERVVFAGEHHNPYPLYAAADAFVLPSRREGFPNVLLEAMALGIPCVAADCETGPAEIIEDGVNGLLVPPEDPVALGIALKALFDDRALRERLGSAGRRTVTGRFGADRMIEEIAAVLMELIP